MLLRDVKVMERARRPMEGIGALLGAVLPLRPPPKVRLSESVRMRAGKVIAPLLASPECWSLLERLK